MRAPQPDERTLARRTLLAGGAGAAAFGLVGCGDGGGEGGGGGLGEASTFEIPDPAPGFPTEPSKLTWTDGSEFSGSVLPTFFEAYQAKHENVSVVYNNLSNQDLTRTLQLGFSNGDLPDVFRLIPQVLPQGLAVSGGHVQAIDDLIPDVEQWKSQFDEGSFTEGLNVFNGKTYSFPMLGPFCTVLMYNREYMAQADLDPTEQPFTFEDFRAAARKLTAQGEGRYFGLIVGGSDHGRWQLMLLQLGALAGAAGESFDYRRGEFNYTSDAYAEVIELILAMKADGSIDPGAVSMTTEQARARLASGQAAMIINETGIVPRWLSEQPDFDFGIAALPAQPGDRHIAAAANLSNFWWLSAKASDANKVIAGDILSYLASDDGLRAWQQVGGASLPVARAAANEVEGIDERLAFAHRYFAEVMRIAPSPEARTAGASVVTQFLQPVSPTLGALVQGMVTGQVSDPAAVLRDLQDKSDRALDEAIAKARAEGAEVSRDDWKFENWDPTRNYTQADYDAL